ncbi:MAG: adenosylcobinamide-phosphate synthase CbiB [Woeseiaceae bacterium]
MLLTFSVLIALIIDLFVGEPRRWHPLVGFGNVANGLENTLNNVPNKSPFLSRLKGLVAWCLLILPIVILLWLFEQQVLSTQANIILGIACLTFAIGTKSLMQHARAVANALKESDLLQARKKIAMIVSRDTSSSDETAINKATIESVLENGSDAIFAAIFWFAVLGAPGVVLYRLANTLDAMWGYRTERYNTFGWAAARIDDGLNWLPARLTALSYALAGNIRSALSSWKNQAKFWHGINPGVVMASGAGALNVKLGGAAIYHGENIKRPELGCDNTAQVADIDRSIQLVNKSIIIWLLVITVGDYFIV